MLELRFHGRGGQGAVTSAELLAQSAIAKGIYAQAFPSFGPERRGAPVVAFARISEQPIRNRTAVRHPNIVLVLDPSILRIVNTADGLPPDGIHIINTTKTIAELREEFGDKIGPNAVTLDANHIAQEEIGRKITNTTMLGALLRATNIVDKDILIEKLKERFGRIADGNIRSLNRAFEECCIEKKEG
ncbi:MAG: 2-oxoacid:acceptor oxidoreductase family protein [Proteobacteria bacterium]|nr:2-oxoacid:acceptor oxidoreductase family protein [Pseudomonadota bacterium]NLN61474.1 pyruvate synthase [Myxococcales bacterium]